MTIRLLQLVHGYPPAIGGVELNVRDIVEGLVARFGYEVTVFTTNAYTNENFRSPRLPTIPIVEGEVQNGVRVRRFPVDTRWSRPLRVLQKGMWTFRLPGNDRVRTLYQGPISPAMASAVLDFDCDVICAASFPLNHMTFPFRRPQPRPPIILVGALHTNDAWGFRRRHLIDLIAESYAYVAHTAHEKEWLIARGAPARRIRVIAHGIDLRRHRATPGRFRAAVGIPAGDLLIAYVGQQGGHKGIDVLLGAWPGVQRALPDAQLVVAGSVTPYSPVLRRMAAKLPPAARGRLRIIDNLPDDLKSDVLEDCDIFTSPSGHESFGLTILEAWAHSKPVVVGDIPAIRQVVDRDLTGVLVAYGSEEELAAALEALGRDPDRRRALGEAGHRKLVAHHTLEQEVARYNGLFREAVAYGAPVDTVA